MKRALFYDPNPNDGTGCAEPIPVSLHCYLQQIDGVVIPVEEVIAAIKEIEPDCDVRDAGDYLGISLGSRSTIPTTPPLPIREFNWRAIRYVELGY